MPRWSLDGGIKDNLTRPWSNCSSKLSAFFQVALLVSALLFAWTSGIAKAANEIHVGSELDFPPYAFVDENGQPAGFSVDLIRAITAAMGLPITITTGPWDKMWMELTAGRLDILPIVAKSPDRQRLVDFSLPHTETYDAFFVRGGSPPIPDIEGAKGKDVVVMRSDAAHHELEGRKFQGRLILVDTIPQGLSLVASGKHDAFLGSKLIGTMVIKEHAIEGLSAGPPISDYKRIFCLAVKKGDAELMEKLNQGLLIIKANGEYGTIYEKWLTADDPWVRWKKYLIPGIGILTLIGLILTSWLFMLKLQVRRRTQELAEKNEMLRQAGERLEVRVATRTAELEQVNASLQVEVAERRQAEDALRESEDRLRMHRERMPIGCIVYDERNCFSQLNPAAQAIFGYSETELLGRHANSIVPEAVRPHVDGIMRRLAEGDMTAHSVNENVTRDGRIIICQWTNTPLRDVVGRHIGFLSMVEDVTEAKRAEAALRQSESRFRLLSETAGQLLATQNPQGIVEELCKDVMGHLECHVCFNFLVDEALGKLHLSACAGIPDEEARKIEWLDYGVAVCGCLAQAGERIVAEDIFHTPDIRTDLVKSYGIQAYACHPLMVQERLIGTLSFGTRTRSHFSPDELVLMKTVADQVASAMERMQLISALQQSRDELELRVSRRTEELQKANEILRRQEEEISKAKLMLQSVFDGISDPLFLLDSSLSVRICNESARNYFHVTSSEAAAGRLCHELAFGRSEPCEHCVVLAAVSEGSRKTFERKGLFDPERIEEVTVYPSNEATGGFSGAIIRIGDITETRNMEKQLTRADRLSSLGVMAGGIAHEIRNPLAGINLFLDVLSDEERFSRSTQEQDIFDEIRSNIRKIDGIIKRTLAFSRRSETAPISRVDVGLLVKESLNPWHSRIVKDGIQLRTIIDEDLPEVFGDPIEIQQVLTNLIQNALEAMNGGGTLTVSTKKGTFSFDDKRPALIIKVRDSGHGIPLDQQKHIFNPFFTTKYTGTGLGLAISHRIMSRHGGLLSFESTPNEGTTFTLELSAAPVR